MSKRTPYEMAGIPAKAEIQCPRDSSKIAKSNFNDISSGIVSLDF